MMIKAWSKAAALIGLDYLARCREWCTYNQVGEAPRTAFWKQTLLRACRWRWQQKTRGATGPGSHVHFRVRVAVKHVWCFLCRHGHTDRTERAKWLSDSIRLISRSWTTPLYASKPYFKNSFIALWIALLYYVACYAKNSWSYYVTSIQNTPVCIGMFWHLESLIPGASGNESGGSYWHTLALVESKSFINEACGYHTTQLYIFLTMKIYFFFILRYLPSPPASLQLCISIEQHSASSILAYF